MTITQMECFVEAAKCRSFTKAGINLYISQQTVSRHIKALETELGISLFKRNNTGVMLTDAGESLYKNWSVLLPQIQTSVDRAKDIYYRERQKIKIGIQDNLGIYINDILETLVNFEKIYPDLKTEYEILSVRKLVESMDAGKVQIVFLYSSELEKIPDIRSLRIPRMQVHTGIFCSVSHPLSRKEKLEAADLCGQVIGLLSNEVSLDNKYRIHHFLQQNQIEDKVRLQEYSSRQNLGIALITGKCVTISYSSMFENLRDKLSFYPLQPETGSCEIALAWNEERYTVKAGNIRKQFMPDNQ